ncbi:MAG: hypothetical protein IKU26_03210 [Clostridia bacterium]|nr:hypothetical protein [Clostridia bacterium]
MKILEAIAKYPAEQKLKIGAADGTGWWYVGTVGDVRMWNEALDEKCHKYAMDIQKNAVKSLNARLKNQPTPEAFARAQIKKAEDTGEYLDLSREAYQAALEKYFADVRKAISYLKTASQRLKEYVKLQDKPVVDCAMCDPAADFDTLRVITEGYENGAFWTTDEAVKLPSVGFMLVGMKGKEDGE